jgi:FlaA1/EpsC-like NDP-sugar epimerase
VWLRRLGDIASPTKIDHLFKRYRAYVVFHAEIVTSDIYFS